MSTCQRPIKCILVHYTAVRQNEEGSSLFTDVKRYIQDELSEKKIKMQNSTYSMLHFVIKRGK